MVKAEVRSRNPYRSRSCSKETHRYGRNRSPTTSAIAKKASALVPLTMKWGVDWLQAVGELVKIDDASEVKA